MARAYADNTDFYFPPQETFDSWKGMNKFFEREISEDDWIDPPSRNDSSGVSILPEHGAEIYMRVSNEIEGQSMESETATINYFTDFSHEPGKKFKNQIMYLLKSEPYEDGYIHPAEEWIEKFINEDKESAVRWFEEVISNHESRSMAASLLECIGQLEAQEVEGWGLKLAGQALKDKNIEVRDAAVEALASWGTPSAASLLKSHYEEVEWLRGYISRIIEEIT